MKFEDALKKKSNYKETFESHGVEFKTMIIPASEEGYSKFTEYFRDKKGQVTDNESLLFDNDFFIGGLAIHDNDVWKTEVLFDVD